MQIIISIDIGYNNLGLVKSTITDSYKVEVNHVELIDLKAIPHRKVPRHMCCLYHTNETADLVAHFIQEYRDILEEADTILIERQPPGGLTNIEALLFYAFRDRCVLVSPNAMHAHFSIGSLDYEHRKVETTRIAEEYHDLSQYTRKHDIADAICMTLFHTHKDRERHRRLMANKYLPFDEYRYDHG